MGEMRNKIDSLLSRSSGPASAMAQFHSQLLEDLVKTIKEATPAMIEAGERAIKEARSNKKKLSASDVWRAMVGAV